MSLTVSGNIWPSLGGPPFSDYPDMFEAIFLWLFGTLTLVFWLAGCIAFFFFRTLRLSGFLPLFFLIFGSLLSCLIGSIGAAIIAGIYYNGGFPMPRSQALLFGATQSAIVIFFSFTRLFWTM